MASCIAGTTDVNHYIQPVCWWKWGRRYFWINFTTAGLEPWSSLSLLPK
jgi:hypothetical protein